MPAAPPAAETRKPASAPPAKAPPDKSKTDGKPADKSAAGGTPKATEGAPGKAADKHAGPSNGGSPQAASPAKPGAGRDGASSQQRFDRMAVRAKLAVSEPGDAVEREADAIASKAMRAPAPDAAAGAKPVAAPAASSPQAIQRKPESPAQSAAGNAPTTPTDLIARLGAGAPLDPDARAFFEQRLGRSLADVRVHTDDGAADAARSLQARAFTWGRHIAFASGEYRPASQAGRELIAHELAHVLQNDAAGLSHVVARKKDQARIDDGDDVKDIGAFDSEKDKAARPALQTLRLPAIKARHADTYKKVKLSRPAGYDRKNPDYKPAQKEKWTTEVNPALSGFYSKLKEPEQPDSLKFYGTPKQKIPGDKVVERLLIPQWGPDGTWRSMQVDHIVELQLGGADAATNYELFSGVHNTNVGSLLRSVIYANVKTYLAAVGKNTGDSVVKDYLEYNTIDFKKVEAGGEGKNAEATSQFWALDQIKNGAHLSWLRDEDRPQGDDGTDKTRFALYSYSGNGFIDAFPLSGNKVSVVDSGRLFGIAIDEIGLNKGFDKAGSGPIGSLKGSWKLPKGAKTKKPKAFQSTLNAVADKPYAGALSSLPPPEVEIEGASPVSFDSIDFTRGKVAADGTLKTEHPLFSGLPIPVEWRGDEFALSYTIDGPAFKLPVPGLTVDDSSVSLSFGSRGLGIEGSLGFTVAGLGGGSLGMSATYGEAGPEIGGKGSFVADRQLFDVASMSVAWSTADGFSGSGKLGIVNPEKIKGIKSATLEASFAKGIFSAKGDVMPDIPGLKSASLGVAYGKDSLVISGSLDIDDKVPGVQSGHATVTVAKGGPSADGGAGTSGWAVSATGEVTPKIAVLKGATLGFAYEKGDVTMEVKDFQLDLGRISGKFSAGVTNAPIDAGTGKKTGQGNGSRSFRAFGAADIHCDIYPEKKIGGNLGLRLLPDGSVRAKGSVDFGEIELFPQIPENAELFKAEISSPRLPVPGLGATVGSMSIGLSFWAEAFARGYASVGPGHLSGKIGIKEFDPGTAKWDTLEFTGHATLSANAQAGIELGGNICVGLSAAVVEGVAKLGLTGGVKIPDDRQPALKADADFTYSADKGLDVKAGLKVELNPALELALKGTLVAQANLYVKTITIWSHEWELANVKYPLTKGLKVDKSLAYNSKSGKFDTDPGAALNIGDPNIKPDKLAGPLANSKTPIEGETTDLDGKPVSDDDLVCREPLHPNVCSPDPIPSEPKSSINPAHEPGAAAPPSAVDEGVVDRLGPGLPLDLATQGFFEQELKTPLTEVRVHIGPEAQREAKRMSARAFTVGFHIAFAQGLYRPNTPEGRELLAHELAHVVQQQGGAARAAMREPDETPAGATPPTATPPAAATAAAPLSTPAGPAVATSAAAAKGPIVLPGLKLPALKYGTDAANSHRKAAYDAALAANVERPAGYRRADFDSRQSRLWTQATPANQLRTALMAKVPGLDVSKVYVALPRSLQLSGGGAQVVVGAPNELALALRQPRWDRQGQADEHPLEIDHIVELQIGGPAYDRLSNLELLERSANGASGRAIDGFMDEAFTAYAASPAAASLPAEDRNAEALKRQYRVRFGGFTVQGGPATGKRWTLDEVRAGDPAEGLRIYDPANLTGPAPTEPGAVQPWPAGVDATRYTGSAHTLVVYPSARGGEPREVPLRDGQPANPAQAVANLLPGLNTDRMTLTLGSAGEGPIGQIRGALTHAQLGPDARIPVDIPLQRRRGLTNAAVLNTDTAVARLRSLLREGGVTALSPIAVDDLEVVPGIGLSISGRVEPTIEMIRNASLDFQVRGDELRVSKTFTGGDIQLGGPLRVDGSDLTVGLGTRSGLTVDGGVAFSIERLGRGLLRGAGRTDGFAVDGRFDFDPRLFDADAHIQLGYRRGADAPDGKLSGSGAVAIGPGKVRGLRRATVQASFDGENRSLAGSAELDIPGVESASLGVRFTPEGGTQIEGTARFRDRPGLRNGQIGTTLIEASDGWHMAASGHAEASFAGVAATLDASYADGLFMFAADAPFAIGERVRGHVRLGATNGQVDAEGRLVPGSAPAAGSGTGELRPFGNGSVTVRLTDWLQGGVGIKVRPSGDLLIGGRIGIPQPIAVFDAYPPPDRATRTLFSMPTVSVPLVGVSVGSTVVGVALTIDGRVTGHAQVGPGRLTQTELRIEDFNPAQPDSLHVTGDARFNLAAEAGVAASLDAGVSLGAAVISATAGVNVSASASLVASATPAVHLDWRAATGLALHADLDASLTPKLAFDVNGFAEVKANAFVTSFSLWRKDWNLAHREIGSNLALRLHAPVDYFSDGRGVQFDPAQVRFEVPTLNGDTLRQLLNGDGGQEHAERDATPGRQGAAAAPGAQA